MEYDSDNRGGSPGGKTWRCKQGMESSFKTIFTRTKFNIISMFVIEICLFIDLLTKNFIGNLSAKSN